MSIKLDPLALFESSLQVCLVPDVYSLYCSDSERSGL